MVLNLSLPQPESFLEHRLDLSSAFEEKTMASDESSIGISIDAYALLVLIKGLHFHCSAAVNSFGDIVAPCQTPISMGMAALGIAAHNAIRVNASFEICSVVSLRLQKISEIPVLEIIDLLKSCCSICTGFHTHCTKPNEPTLNSKKRAYYPESESSLLEL
ncbi:hypothetical protein KIN20_030983 [Parelaphostrongylus tenuis]|uniref:Uncharacterized protein n=1 Tax=Parelaphostrongylus tenuis TaxID=148309 RepID=A0AAD5R4I0_PARTN|nr:hypothetical protein KIN20_030983 [Parelaphostrongylus tenuis]